MASSDPDEAYRQFTTGVALITTNGRKGPNVMAAEWTFNVSYEPFLISVHLTTDEATYEAIAETREFGVNVAAEDQIMAVAFAGHFTKHETDKLSSELFQTYPASKINVPMIKGCVLNAECKLIQKIPMGDHVAMIGEVVHFTVEGSKGPVVLHGGSHKLGSRITRGVALAVAVTPMQCASGAEVTVEGELSSSDRGRQALRVSIETSGGVELLSTAAETDQWGFFAQTVRMPETARAGEYSVVVRFRSAVGRARMTVK